jgi:hypothetical protein
LATHSTNARWVSSSSLLSQYDMIDMNAAASDSSSSSAAVERERGKDRQTVGR